MSLERLRSIRNTHQWAYCLKPQAGISATMKEELEPAWLARIGMRVMERVQLSRSVRVKSANSNLNQQMPKEAICGSSLTRSHA